jgi:hypothetical protein
VSAGAEGDEPEFEVTDAVRRIDVTNVPIIVTVSRVRFALLSSACCCMPAPRPGDRIARRHARMPASSISALLHARRRPPHATCAQTIY